jgi:hypothetical protein
MADVTDREKLEMSCRSTIEFNFGSICDVISRGIELKAIDPQFGEAMKRQVRKYGNDSIRVISNHLEYYNVSRNHRKDAINKTRVLAEVQEG